MGVDMSLQQHLVYYEADARRYEERAMEAREAGYHSIATHLDSEAARFRALCTQLTESSAGFLVASAPPSLPCSFCLRGPNNESG